VPKSTVLKVAIFVLFVAMLAGTLGFVTGFATHTVLVVAQQTDAPLTIVEVTATPAPAEATVAPTVPTEASPTSPPEPEPEPSPAPTIEIPPASGATFDLFWEAWELIQTDYYGDRPTEEEMTYGAIRGAVDTLGDPFTAFIDPQIAAINREDATGTFEGIGAYVTMEEGRLSIVSPFEDQPAEQAGLRRGDIVLQVDDTPIENMSIYEAITLIRGPAGTLVRLTILREGEEPFEVEITRASIEIPLVESEMREDGIAYVDLHEFSSGASERLGDTIQEMLQQEPAGLILDLRGNPGGWLEEAVRTAGLFLPQDEVVLLERFSDGSERDYRVPDAPIAADIPMVVLVDVGSASGSEIVAGALQDHGRALLIGETTFGKGSVQWVRELSNGSELRVTVARWFTPNDRAIHGEGLDPDLIIELTEEDLEAELDPQLDRAVEYLLTGQ
jgi:carboxyl-terminal processing protease